MPEISLFYGIRVSSTLTTITRRIFASYAESVALVDIQNVCVLKGFLPNRQLRLVLAWCTIHQDELMQNWELARDGKPLTSISPLM